MRERHLAQFDGAEQLRGPQKNDWLLIFQNCEVTRNIMSVRAGENGRFAEGKNQNIRDVIGGERNADILLARTS